jgi:hypothetical protein
MERLLRARQAGSVSIYVPTTPITAQVEATRIDFRNAVDEAIAQLRDADFDKRQVTALDGHLRDVMEDDQLWEYQAHSLAVLATAERAITFRLANRVTRAVEVSDRFHLKPLFRALTFPQAALVLALAAGSVRLVEVSPDLPAEAIRIPDLPKDAASAVGKSSIKDRAPVGRIQGSEGEKTRLTQYARAVSRAIAPAVGLTDVPLILATTEPMASIYRGVEAAPSLVAQDIDGSPEQMSDAQLASAARSVLDNIYAQQLADVRALFMTRRAAGRGSTDLAQVARAATMGAVDTVLVDMDATLPGYVDEETGAISLEGVDDAHDYGVGDEIARRTYLNGGRVLSVRADDIPDGKPVAAIFRFAF